MKIPYKILKKLIPNWHVGYIDFSLQEGDFHKRIRKHLGNSKNYLGEYRGIYYFQFDTEEKLSLFLKLMEYKLKQLNVRTI